MNQVRELKDVEDDEGDVFDGALPLAFAGGLRMPFNSNFIPHAVRRARNRVHCPDVVNQGPRPPTDGCR